MGGGIGMGNTCKPMAVLFQCMTKFTTNKLINKLKKNKKSENIKTKSSKQITTHKKKKRQGLPHSVSDHTKKVQIMWKSTGKTSCTASCNTSETCRILCVFIFEL